MLIETLTGIAPVAPSTPGFGCILDSVCAAADEPLQLDKLLLSRKEVAYMLGISVRSVAYLISAGKLPVRRIGGRVLHEREVVHKIAAQGVRRITV